MNIRLPERSHVRPARPRRGWIPLGLSGQVLLASLLVPAAALAPRAGAAVIDELERAVHVAWAKTERGSDAVRGWAASVLDPDTRAGESARDERWASSRR
jgi:hypothetical protein